MPSETDGTKRWLRTHQNVFDALTAFQSLQLEWHYVEQVRQQCIQLCLHFMGKEYLVKTSPFNMETPWSKHCMPCSTKYYQVLLCDHVFGVFVRLAVLFSFRPVRFYFRLTRNENRLIFWLVDWYTDTDLLQSIRMLKLV